MSVVGSRLEGVPHFDFTVTGENLDKQSKMMLKEIKGDWNLDELCMKEFSGGISNKLVGFFTKGTNTSPPRHKGGGGEGRSDVVLVRIYGENTDLIIDREQELYNIKELSHHNIAPQLYCTFLNGYCYGFVEGDVCVPESFTDATILKQSAELMAKIHTISLSSSYLARYEMKATVFEKIRQYINVMPRSFPDPSQQQRFHDDVPTPDKLHAEVDMLETRVKGLNDMVMTFCHNDLLVANYIFNTHTEQLHCIDYEYGQPNYSAYDIGNHFNEFCGVDVVDYNLYPTKHTQLQYIRQYLHALGHREVDDVTVEQWYVNVEHMSLVSHMFWGVWAQIQAANSTIDFDFLGYGIIRLNEYYRRKEQVLGKL